MPEGHGRRGRNERTLKAWLNPHFEYGTNHKLGKIGDGIRLWAEIDADLLLAVFLPALLFESAFSMEVHQIKRCMAQMLLLAGPGVLISTFCLGLALKLTFPYNWSWKISLLLGGLLSATDPVAVVALFKELGASKKLTTIIEGESLMNDGTAIVVYQLFYKMVLGQSFTWATVIEFLAKVTLGAVGIGIAFGLASVFWLRFIFNDTLIEIALTVAVSYIAYFTAQLGFDISGVLAVMTLGMFYAAYAKTAFKGGSQQSLHRFWGMVAYIANTLIFILSGVVIAKGVLVDSKTFVNHGYSWGYLILLYVFVQVSRCIVVGVLFPFLQYFGYGLDLKEAAILTWSGLRGVVALALSLSFKNSSMSLTTISSETGSLFVFFTGGIVFLTLIINGSTTQFILHFLGMDKLSVTKRRILDYTKYEMLDKALEAFENLVDDEELGPADWPTVKKYIASLNNLEGDPVLHVVKTRQVAYSVLNHLLDYVQNLEKVGLLEEKEMLHLHDAVQTDLKKLLRNPPLVKIPKAVHPFLGALPPALRKQLEGSQKEITKTRGVTLYKEDSNPNGIWLIANGIVKWTSKSIKNKHSLHPTFTHGSTLGLYEVLTGKQHYICDMITDSMVLCFFLESDKIRFLRSHPEVEDFLWQFVQFYLFPQESAIILAKLLLPQVFEKMEMQDLRALVTERSVMKTYISGESMEVPPQYVGFLLEGFVKPHGVQEELIASPAVLLPLQQNQSFHSVDTSGARAASFSYQRSCYQVESRARIILFDTASFVVDNAIGSRQRSLSREHGGLMSWPEHFYNVLHPEQNHGGPGGTSQQANSLSAIAMQPSISGSTDFDRVDLKSPVNELWKSEYIIVLLLMRNSRLFKFWENIFLNLDS
ncbi:hypothetical protein SLEP1_g10696 [Rubroshorea leprosula]|uniref:Cation/H+ exchanger transmembrane domain-containing protein n=1 Tax=Rubroshorea leprosula TaxID=152421 RepID=A0AAV5IIU3_9ROSI|nr:hypothetical protein SLEP1_g10696 [Rubroshorea leprosula]